MEDLAIFNFGENEVRTIEQDGEVWFVASDVAKSLEYKNISDAISRHCEYVAKHDTPHPQSKSKTIEVSIIPEPDLYALIFGSKLKSAKAFKKWVFSEVLPSIRKTGKYEVDYKAELEQAIKERDLLEFEVQKKDIELKQAAIFMTDGEAGEVSKVTGEERYTPVKGYFRSGKPKSEAVCNIIQQFFKF